MMRYADWTQRRAEKLAPTLGRREAERQALADALHHHLRENLDHDDAVREMFEGLLDYLEIQET